MSSSSVRKQDLVLSGGFGSSTNSTRSGYLPVPLARLLIPALDGIAIYLRTMSGAEQKERFTLLTADTASFTEQHRERLIGSGVKFVYITIAQHQQFREQTEAKLLEMTTSPDMAASVKYEIIYETSVELANELLSEPDLASKSHRLDKISRAVTTLVLQDQSAFSHLFTASHHDFYTATHMVNVATWMVPVAYAMGHQDTEELNQICQAGLLHDIGKIFIPGEILNKKGKLSREEFDLIKKHPQLGIEYLSKYNCIDPLIRAVAVEHHERMDGTGYPYNRKGSELHPISRICAVIDSFDAMTAFRPFKEKTLSVTEAMEIIVKETPDKYDPKVVDAWVALLRKAEVTADGASGAPANSRRAFERFTINCPARLHIMERAGEEWRERPGVQAIAHNISRGGVGILSQTPIQPGEHVRVYLLGKGTLSQTRDGVCLRCRDYRDGWFEIGTQSAPAPAESEADFTASVASAA